VEFLRRTGSALIGDEPGVGKTAQVISLTQDVPKVLILTMSSLKFQFGDEIRSWLPEARITVINGSQAERNALWATDSQYYIANYELLLRYDWGRMKAIPWTFIVCDECTRLSNPNNKQYRALKQIQSQYRVAMTGTAISNAPTDAYGIFEWLYPGIFRNYYAFINKYCIKDYFGSVKGFKNLDHLASVIAPYYIRRTKEQVLPELPEKVQSIIPVELSDKERKLYDQIRMALLFDINQSDVNKVKNLTQIQNGVVKLTRLRQACNSMELLGESTDSSKIEALKELLTTLEII